ncbi:recombinase family protein [Streptomyces sp. HNM0574]|uniref:recombinase family protein n=1 Tax=Streptomyces sp. HNM0574 TaxID=2714954 RepID=UPI00146C5F1E|nr:recombinase family protein [Streptomyces sp. HNM0574]NLU66088.1 hypothetical protein [Streptomyces sp. HNM0574]
MEEADAAFLALAAGPRPLTLPAELFAPRLSVDRLPVDQVQARLPHPAADARVRVRTWDEAVVRHARQGEPWDTVAVGLIVPALRRALARLPRLAEVEHAKLEQEVLTAVAAELAVLGAGGGCRGEPDAGVRLLRATRAWAKTAVHAILGNPRYTGRQVWNRQHKHESLLDIHDVSLGYTTKLRWNSQHKWIVSKEIVHTPLVDDETFARAQDIFQSRSRSSPAHGVRRTRNVYALRGAVECGPCGRKMQGNWAHDEAYYRCRFPDQYALANRVQHPRNVYVREVWLLKPLDDWLAKVFLPHRIDETIDQMASAAAEEPDHSPTEASETAARALIAECDASWPPTEPRSKQEPIPHWSPSGSPRPRPAGTKQKPNCEPAQQKVLAEIHLDQHSRDSRGLPARVRGGT